MKVKIKLAGVFFTKLKAKQARDAGFVLDRPIANGQLYQRDYKRIKSELVSKDFDTASELLEYINSHGKFAVIRTKGNNAEITLKGLDVWE